ncbi:MAG: phosphoribosylanthranilate isomerase [Pseudomonadota bacterium]
MTRVKICGVRSPAVAEHVSAVGADALGLVFFGPSPRAIDIDRAVEVAAAVDPLLTLVGLFVNPDRREVENTLERCPIDILQFHGDEDEAFCAQFGKPFFKAIAMRPDLDLRASTTRFPSARALLFDAWSDGRSGGTGKTFDWKRLPLNLGSRWILAGGLSPQNVAGAIKATNAPVVDVSGGVESSPGVKDVEKIDAFMAAVRAADERRIEQAS